MSFDNRRDSFEKKFSHDQDLQFRTEARASKLFGLWVASQLGLTGADAETYAKDVVGANLQEVGFDDIKRKVKPDLAAKGVDVSEHALDAHLHNFVEEAKRQIMETMPD